MSRLAIQSARELESKALHLARLGKMKEAVAASQRLNKQFPSFASGWYCSSQLAEKLRNPAMALQAIERAIRLEPDEVRWQIQKASCLMQSGQVQLARPIIIELNSEALTSGYQCASLGLMLSRLDLQEEALEQYRRAISLEPQKAEHHYNIATVYRFLGDFESADQALANAIERNPRDFEAHKLRSDLRKQTLESNHVAELRQKLNDHREDQRAQVQLNYALAKELEDLEQWRDSFAHLRRGANSRRRLMRYRPDGDLETIERIAQVYQADLFDGSLPGHDSSEPIFILGLPRTGSTLLERILGAHSSIYAAGELNNFAFEMTSAVRSAFPKTPPGARPKKLELVDRSAEINFQELGRNYIKSTRPATGNTPHFIDKMPINFLYAGLIHLALPKARIIHVKRHPIDACYAIYKNLFADAYPYSYQLEELGHYYAAYTRLMSHWHSVMPGVVREVHYEDVIADVEGETRRLLSSCDLEWEAQCLDFYSSNLASTTASASQVRQPVYKTSVGIWEHYREELGPLIDVLKEEGVEVTPL